MTDNMNDRAIELQDNDLESVIGGAGATIEGGNYQIGDYVTISDDSNGAQVISGQILSIERVSGGIIADIRVRDGVDAGKVVRVPIFPRNTIRPINVIRPNPCGKIVPSDPNL